MKKFIFLILVISIFGCVSQKKAMRETVKQATSETVDLSVKEAGAVVKVDNVVKDVKVSVTDKSVTTTTETEYSAPDAAGKQHKTKEKTTETRNDVNVVNEANERIISEQKQVIERQSAYISSLETRLSAALSEKTKTSTRTPIWVYLAFYVGGLFTIPLFRLWLKK